MGRDGFFSVGKRGERERERYLGREGGPEAHIPSSPITHYLFFCNTPGFLSKLGISLITTI